jgi:tetratricopeptide (TPR) repeat protein
MKTEKMIHLTVRLGTLLFSAILAFPVVGASQSQTRRPNIEKNNISVSKDTGTTKAKAEPKASSRPAKGAAKSSPTTGRAGRYKEQTLTFTTNVSGSDVFLDGEKLGRTDFAGKLTTKVKHGRYFVSAQHPDYREHSKTIDVGPGLTDISFNLEAIAVAPPKQTPAAPKPTSLVTAVEPAKTEPAAEIIAKPTVSAEEIIRRFLDSRSPDVVTEADWKEVLSQSEKALAQQASNTQIKARMLFAHGQLAYLKGDYAIALVAFNEATKAQPNLAPAFYGSGNAFVANNLLPEALKAYQQAVQLQPDFILAHKALGDAYTKSGNYKEASASYLRARQKGYNSPDLVLAIARSHMREQRWNQALDELKPLALEGGVGATVLVTRGECYEGLKYPLSAALAYSKAVEADTNNPIALYKLGSIFYTMREFRSAKEALDRAIILDPKGEKINLSEARRKAQDAASKASR